MKNKALNTLGYTGIVTLSRNVGSKKIKIAQVHNTGASSLFDFLSDCLIGEFEVARLTRPAKIKLLYVDGSSYSSASGFIGLLTKPVKVHEPNQSRIRYSFVIPRDYLEGIDSFNSLGLGLYANGALDSKLEDFSAFCALDLDKNALTGASLVVDWELVISNVGTAV